MVCTTMWGRAEPRTACPYGPGHVETVMEQNGNDDLNGNINILGVQMLFQLNNYITFLSGTVCVLDL